MLTKKPPKNFTFNADTDDTPRFRQGSMTISGKITHLHDEEFDIDVVAFTRADEAGSADLDRSTTSLTAVVRIVDCICDWKRAEELAGDVRQLHRKRLLKVGKVYADVWVWCQLVPVVYDRIMDFVRKFYAARAGK